MVVFQLKSFDAAALAVRKEKRIEARAAARKQAVSAGAFLHVKHSAEEEAAAAAAAAAAGGAFDDEASTRGGGGEGWAEKLDQTVENDSVFGRKNWGAGGSSFSEAVQAAVDLSQKDEGGEDDEAEEDDSILIGRRGINSIPLQYNPLQRSLPDLTATEPQYLALVLPPAGSRASAAMAAACSAWRAALCLHGLQEHRGGGDERHPLPPAILRAFISHLDSIGGDVGSEQEQGFVSTPLTGSASAQELTVSHDTLLAMAHAGSASGSNELIIGSGFLAMRCCHALNETKRLTSPRHAASNAASPSSKNDSSVLSELVVVMGHAGSGVLALGSQIAERLSRKAAAASSDFSTSVICGSVFVDLSSSCLNIYHDNNIGEEKDGGRNIGTEASMSTGEAIAQAWERAMRSGGSLSGCTMGIVTLITSPQSHGKLDAVLALLAGMYRSHNAIFFFFFILFFAV